MSSPMNIDSSYEMYVILDKNIFEILSGNGIVYNPQDANIFLFRSYLPYFLVISYP
jgi:hypothetical protein